MTALSAFLPIDRRIALNEGRVMPDRVQGAALFADISGFTPLTATMRHELGARRGAEEVIRHLDIVFAALIARIHRYHGDVIGFSGDAITCWFDDSRAATGAESAAARAVAAAFALQEYMADIQAIATPGGTRIPLAIKVAVAAGPARRFLVGEPRTYVIEVIAGDTVDRTSTAEKLAERGEVIVSAEVLDRLAAPPEIAGWRAAGAERFAVLGRAAPIAPQATRAAPALDDETARPWLLPPVYEDLRQAAADFLAELRPAVPVFVRFSGIDFDFDDEAGAKLDQFVRHAQAILDRYEGFLVQITMGDKGSYLYITFGAPVAHENDDIRAAAAALELRDLPTALPFLDPLTISISRGLIHSGAYGGPERRTFAVMGNEVNVAARLMTAAQPGQVLISGRVAAAIADEFETLELHPIMLKGMDEPFAVSTLVARRAAAHGAHRPRDGGASIGREVERATMESVLADLATGNSLTLIIEGAAGLGKSLLLNEMAEKAAALPDVLSLMGFGDAIERSTPYYSWRPVFETLFVAGEQPTEAWRDRFIARLDPATQSLAPLLNAVLPLDLPDNDLTAQLSGEARLDNTHQVLIELLRLAAGGQPLVLMFDDAHWMDSVSWTLAARARRELERVLIVLGLRPFGDDAPPIFTELRGSPATRLVTIGTLPPGAIEELVRRRLGIRRLPAEVARLIHEKAEGHPFFSEELAYALRDAGLLRIEGDEARLAPGANLADLDFPTTIQGVITSRIDRLSPSQQLTVKVASVIGRIFAVRVLGGVYPIEGGETQLRANLKRLERLDITPEETPDPNLAYIFKHIVTQEVVYSLMTFAQRSQLHRNTALWYENQAGGDPARYYPLLAHHWRLAGEAGKAIDYYEKAGENAIRDFANQEAVRFFEGALELAGENVPAVRQARWRRLLGEARYRLTQVDGSLDDYNKALALLGRPIPGSAGGRGAGVGRAVLRQLAHRAAAGRLVGSAGGEQREALLEASRVLEGTAEIYYNTGDFLTSFYCTMNAFNLAERAGPSPELMRGYANMCATLGVVSLNSAADRYRHMALALEPQIDDLPARAWSRISLSTHSVWVADWDRAEREISEALAIYTQLGDWRRWGVAAWLWPQVAQSRGQLARARDLWAELHAVAARNRDTRHEVRGRGGQFFNFLSLDQPEEARSCLAAVATVLDANPEMMPVEERLWHAANAAWAVREGDWTQARASAQEALAAIGRARFKFDLLEVFATPAEVFLVLWARGEASAAETESACKVLASYARTYAFARPRALRVRGQYARMAGNAKQAARLWAKSVEQAAALDMPHERALTEALILAAR